MTVARDMLDASPAPINLGLEAVAAAIDAAMVCAQTCTSCANSCLAEDDVAEMRRCIALCDVCADVCTTTLRLLSRPFKSDHVVVHRMLGTCVRTCSDSAEECERHGAHHRHCAICAKACRACARACGELLDAEAFGELEKLAGG
jgi:hypothetical protein